MSGNEETAIGAVRAIETAGLDKDSAVIGLGGYLAKDEWNNKGADVAIKAAAYFSADSIGGASAEMLINHINNGTEIPKSTAVPAIVVTPENYKEVMGAAAK
jgi:L-arabinose transport system substrate-binding protein